MALKDWQRKETAGAWSAAVGEFGDIFQSTLTVPYFLAVVQYCKEIGGRLKSRSVIGNPPPGVRAQSIISPLKISELFYKNLEAFWAKASVDTTAGVPPTSKNGVGPISELIAQRLGQLDVNSHPGGFRLLDLGCGEGFLCRLVAAAGGSALGMDGSQDLIDKALEKKKKYLRGTSDDALSFETLSLEAFVKGGTAANAAKQVLAVATDAGRKRPSKVPFPRKAAAVTVERDLEDAPSQLSTREPDLVVISNVFDHIDGTLQVILEGLVNKLGDETAAPLVMVVTLNPDFFFGPRQWDSNACPPAPETTVLGPASLAAEETVGSESAVVRVWPRSSQRFERLFADAGFHVLNCETPPLCLAPRDLRKRYKDSAQIKDVLGLDHKALRPISTPFVLWTLLPAQRGTALSFHQVKEYLEKSKYKCTLSPGPKGTAYQALALHPARLVVFKKSERLAFAHNLGGRCFLIEKDQARMDTRSGTPQNFDFKTPFIGELEAGTDIYGSRYIYDVYAGAFGCTAICFHREAFLGLIAEQEKSLGSQLYLELRDRLTRFSWVYHKSGQHGNSSGIKPDGVTKDGLSSGPDLEITARALLFAASSEASSGVPANGSFVFLDDGQIEALFGKKGDFIATIKDLMVAGAIDACAVMPEDRSSPEVLDIRQSYRQCWEYLRSNAIELILRRGPDKNVAIDAIRNRINKVDILTSGQLFVEKGDGLRLSKAGSDLSRELVGDHPQLKNEIQALVVNLAFLQRSAFAMQVCRAYAINDARLIREIAYDAGRFRQLLVQRYQLGVAAGATQGSKAPYRTRAYLARLTAYAVGMWRNGYDLCFAEDSDQRSTFVARVIDASKGVASI